MNDPRVKILKNRSQTYSNYQKLLYILLLRSKFVVKDLIALNIYTLKLLI